MALLMVFICCLFIQNCLAFNINLQFPIVKNGPVKSGPLVNDSGIMEYEDRSYFGYSVALYEETGVPGQDNTPWLLVGAPKYLGTGGVFKCAIAYDNAECTLLDIDSEVLSSKEHREGQWLGVSIYSKSIRGNDYFVACAHRYGENESKKEALGKCILVENDFKPSQDYGENGASSLCQNMDDNRGHQGYGSCQQGCSSYITDGGNDRWYVVTGAPGAHDWTGFAVMNEIPYSGAFMEREHITKSQQNKRNKKDQPPIRKNSYSGWSVSSGKLIGESNNDILVGAPRASPTSTGDAKLSGKGAALVYNLDPNMEGSDALGLVYYFEGEHVASSFGYAVLVCDVNGDSWDDVIVGSPFYYDEGIGGRVYMYLNQAGASDTKGSFDVSSPSIVLDGKPRSRFGFALATLGDINRDSFQDLVVGAPYEGDTGAIYLYLGAPQGIHLKLTQRIVPSDMKPAVNLVTFGYSLSGSKDLDGNGYPDLAVGAYGSDSAVFFKTRPVFVVVANLTTTPSNLETGRAYCIDRMHDCIIAAFCVFYEQGDNKHLYDEVKVKLTLKVEEDRIASLLPPRSQILPDDNKPDDPLVNVMEIIVGLFKPSADGAKCFTRKLDIKNKVQDFITPIRVSLDFSIIESDMINHDDPLPPIEDKVKSVRREADIEFDKECGSDNICSSDLRLLQVTWTLTNNELRLGNDTQFNVTYEISNANEPAYQSLLLVTLPAGVAFIDKSSASPPCSNVNDSFLECQLGNPFTFVDQLLFTLMFSSDEVAVSQDSSDDSMGLLSVVSTTSTEPPSDTENRVLLVAKLILEADIVAQGVASPDRVDIKGTVIGESAVDYFFQIGPKVAVSFIVSNHGPANLPTASVLHVDWPAEAANGKWLLYMSGSPQLDGTAASCRIPESLSNPLGIEPAPTGFDSTAASRSRRSTENPLPSGGGGPAVNSNTRSARLDCEHKTANCSSFTCDIPKLNNSEYSKVTLEAYVWKSTFFEDHAGLDSVWIVIRGRVSVPNVPHLKQNMSNDYSESLIEVRPEVVTSIAEPIPIWVIIASVLGGVILLALLVCVCWACGFFRRKREPSEQQSYRLANVPPEKRVPPSPLMKAGYYPVTTDA